MFIVSQTIRLEMKPQKITAKPQHQAGFFFNEKGSILPFSNTETFLSRFLQARVLVVELYACLVRKHLAVPLQVIALTGEKTL